MTRGGHFGGFVSKEKRETDIEIDIYLWKICESEEKYRESTNLSALEFFYIYFHVFSKLYYVHDFHYVINSQSRVFGCILDMRLILNCEGFLSYCFMRLCLF